MKNLFDLQLFAEGEEATPDPKAGNPTPNTPQTEGAKQGEGAKPEDVKYSDEDVNRIIDQKFAEWQKKQQKAVDEATKLSAMDTQQKTEYERDKLQKELDEYKRKDSISDMTKTARKMLTDSGITVSDELLAVLVTAEADSTKAAVDGFAKSFTEAVEQTVKERLRGDPPKKGAGGGAPMTKEQINEIKDVELRQAKMLEHKELFNF